MANAATMTAKESLGKLFEKAPSKRTGMPITWVVGEDGVRLPLSVHGDDIIDFKPYIPNPAACARTIPVASVPAVWRTSFLDVVCTFWRYGRPGSSAPKASTVVRAGNQLILFIRWLYDRGINSFREVRPIHVSAFSEHLHTSPITSVSRAGELRKSRGVGNILWACTLPWDLRARLLDAMESSPFPGQNGLTKASRSSKRGRQEGSTYCLTLEEFGRLFDACEAALDGADGLICALEYRHKLLEAKSSQSLSKSQIDRQFSTWLKRQHGISVGQLNASIKAIREAASTKLGMLVGQRISEILSLEQGCYFERELAGVSLGWLKGKTYKNSSELTTWTETEWLAPHSVATLVSYLERLSSLHRPVLRRDIEEIRKKLAKAHTRRQRAALTARLQVARRSLKSIFLTRAVSKGYSSHHSVGIPARGTYTLWLKAMAKRAGLQCVLTQHVLRRTFAFMVIRHCNGDIRYLKVHFQHWSLETTQLYATHDARDEDLADEIGEAILVAKTDLVSSWLDQDAILAGKAGEHIRQTRERPEFLAHTIKDRRELAQNLAMGLNIRPTGHSWCIAEGSPPCGGRGLYDPKECAGDCGSSVITETEVPIWKRLTIQLLEAEKLEDCGPGGIQVLASSLAAFDTVLKPFGLSVETIRSQEQGVPSDQA